MKAAVFACCLVALLVAMMASPSAAYISGYDMPLKYQVDGFTLFNMNTSAYCYYDCDPSLLYPAKCPMSCMPSNRTNLQLFNIVSNLNKDIQKNCWVRPRSVPGQLSPYDGKKLCFPKNASGVGGLPAQDGDVHCNFVVGNNPLRQWDWFQLEKFGGGITAGLDNIYPGDFVRIKYNRTAIVPNDGGYCRGFVDESRFNCKIQNAWEADVFQLGFMSNLDHYNGDNNCCCQADSW